MLICKIKVKLTRQYIFLHTYCEVTVIYHNTQLHGADVCGTLKCENAAICETVAKCEKYSTLNVKIDAICEKITLNVKK